MQAPFFITKLPCNLIDLDRNIESVTSNNTYLNTIKIFIKLLWKMNIIEIQKLIVTWICEKGFFKLTGKNKSVDRKK